MITKPIEFELNCPSGRLVIANDLRNYFKLIENFDINEIAGEAACTLAYAKIGLAHGFVGNTCPGVFASRSKGPWTSFAIGNPADRCKSLKGYPREVAGICTDLWWYSICDRDEFKRRAGFAPEDSALDLTLVAVKPGVYSFKQMHHLSGDHDYKKASIHCLFDWSREPDPVGDLGKIYRELNFTAEEVIGAHAHQWDYFTEKRGLDGARYASMQAVTDYIMCVNGNGVECHPNGWAGDSQNIDTTKAEEIPEFDRPHQWYSLCKYSPIVKLTRQPVINPSFVRLGFNIVRNILVYGAETPITSWPHTPHDSRVHVLSRNSQFRWAWYVYTQLKEKYPDQVPANCADLPKPNVPQLHKLDY